MDQQSLLRSWKSVVRSVEGEVSGKSLIGYCKATYPGFEDPEHIRLIASHLEEVESGANDRLMVIMPPRAGKSVLISELLPAWWMGRSPNSQIIHAGYAQEFIERFARRVRNRMLSAEHLAIFPGSELSRDSRAIADWSTVVGGSYYAVGVGAGVTGVGGSLIVIDDPISGREDADSGLMREKLWDWYLNDVYTRLTQIDSRPPAIVLVQTRWHEDDLAGRLLAAQEDADQWKVLHLPAISAGGAALWPERYPLPWLEKKRRVVGPRVWEALWQGNPTPESGTYFERDWIVRSDPPPEAEMRFYGASDYAVSQREGADYTVHAVVGIDREERMWVMDLWRKQATTGEWVSAAVDMMEKWKPWAWGEEKGVILKSVAPWLMRVMRERGVYVRRIPLTSMGDKEARARSIQGMIERRGLYIPRHAAWGKVVSQELVNFPAGRNDDIVDALALIGRMMLIVRPGDEQPKQLRPWRAAPTFDELFADARKRGQNVGLIQ